MKAALTTLIATALLSTTAIANTFESQHRIGLGYTSTEIGHPSVDGTANWGDGIKLEYGYEFNRIVGINASYGQNDKTILSGLEMEGTSFKVDTDIGYKFLLNGFNIKPYGAIGLIRYSEKMTASIGDIGGSDKWSDTNIFIGTGVRAEIGQNFYTDLRFDFTYFDDEYLELDYDQFSFTVGYKF